MPESPGLIEQKIIYNGQQKRKYGSGYYRNFRVFNKKIKGGKIDESSGSTNYGILDEWFKILKELVEIQGVWLWTF